MPVLRATGWAVLSGCLLLGGCDSPVPASKNTERQPAHLVVMNLTAYRWRITIARPPASPTADFQVEARGSRSIDLAAGEYLITQTVLSEGAASELSRELPAKFESGESYRWRLATLLSEAVDTSPSP